MFRNTKAHFKKGFIIFFLFVCNLSYAQLTGQAKTDSARKGDSINQLTGTKPSVTKEPDAFSKIQKPKDLPGNVQPEVIRVFSYKTNDDKAGIGDMIVIEVLHLKTLLHQKDSVHQKISLYINGRKIENIEPVSGAPEISDTSGEDRETLQYNLDRNTENDKTWAGILGSPSLNKNDFFLKKVKISVGIDYPVKIASDDINFTLIRIHRGWFWTCCFIILIYLIVLYSMVKNGGLLRDRGIDLRALGISTNSRYNSFSLGRFQMAFWFTLTIISFFFIWLITDAYNIISTTVLALIGISAGTSLSAAVIDNNKSTSLLNQTIELQNETAKISIEIPTLQNSILNPQAGANIVDLQSQLTSKNARLLEIQTLIANNKTILTPKTSRGFLNDVLTDENGISFHRLQMLAWTFVLGLIFIYSVWKSLSMPDFDATLLALQGMTAGIYLGFKFPENQA